MSLALKAANLSLKAVSQSSLCAPTWGVEGSDTELVHGVNVAEHQM